MASKLAVRVLGSCALIALAILGLRAVAGQEVTVAIAGQILALLNLGAVVGLLGMASVTR